jgi:hypothetical protein
MRTTTKCLLLCVLAVLVSAGVVRPGIFRSHTYSADGGAPTPPPIPMNAVVGANSAAILLADGGAPTPPPIPMYAV